MLFLSGGSKNQIQLTQFPNSLEQVLKKRILEAQHFNRKNLMQLDDQNKGISQYKELTTIETSLYISLQIDY